MSSETKEAKIEKQITTITVDGFDGFTDEVEGVETDERAAPGSVIQGNLTKFTNEATWVMRDGEEVSPELELIAVDILRVVQKWIDKKPTETRILAPGEKVPDIEALNDTCPKSEWGTDFNGNPQGPYQFQYIVYLLDPVTMDRYTFPTNTNGGSIAVRDLADKTKLMRRFRGQHVYAVVTLADVFMNTKYGGRQRPSFLVKKWVQMGGDDKPALPGPTPTIEAVAEPTKAEPLPGMKAVEEPTLSEQMGGDKVPFNDPLSESVGRSPKPAPTASAPSPRKPAAPSQMTKRGVQKIAGGRGR